MSDGHTRMQTLELNGPWDVTSLDEEISLSVSVPGTVMLALEQAGHFGKKGIFYGTANRLALEYANREYRFVREFELPATMAAMPQLFLEADGLDTLAEIFIDGEPVASTDNMHRRYRFVLNHLSPGTHRMEIVFGNALLYVKQRQMKRFLMTTYEFAPEQAYSGFNQIRKSHCSFGWDWGPIVPDVGIWRPIRLVAYDAAWLEHVTIRQQHLGTQVFLSLHPTVHAECLDGLSLQVTLQHPDQHIATYTGAVGGPLAFEVANPRLWWPNGLGEQPLYRLQITLRLDGLPLQQIDKTIGLRTLEVCQEEDQFGPSFHFRCNGQSFFAMGADYIPEDVFLTRVTAERTRHLLAQAQKAHFNTIRVWGGGVYPDDGFYQCCDEMGLVVWQDYMFACALYDVRNSRFLESIRQEVLDNAKRLHHHASLGLLCGNNEMEWALTEWEDFVSCATDEVKAEYLLQYEDVIRNASREGAPDTFYWPASPSSGGGFYQPNAPEMGDCHYWNVWHQYAPFEEYQQHFFRFMSEFGFEALPHRETVYGFADESERYLTSPVMADHQRCRDGTKKLLHYLRRYFRAPVDFEALIYLSQVCQAEALRHGIEHWRRHRGRCMGAVYWQFNDNWPAVSWSSIDCHGRWKALHYQVKRSYAPLLLSVAKTAHTAEVFLSLEGPIPVEGTVVWELLTLTGAVLQHGTKAVAVAPFESKAVVKMDVTQLIGDIPKTNLLLSCRFCQAAAEDLQVVEHFADFTAITIPPPHIEWRVYTAATGLWVEVSSASPAFFVELSAPGLEMEYSDNFFHLDGRSPHRVEVCGAQVSSEQLQQALVIRSLFDSCVLPD